MKKRMFIMLVVVLGFVAAIGGYKYFQIKSAIAGQSHYKPPPEAVTTVTTAPEEWDATTNAIGSVEAAQGVTVSADLPGVVEAINFESGRMVNKGDVLVRLDARQEQAQLAAALAELDLSRVELQRSRGLLEGKILSQSAYDQAAATFKQSEAKAGELRATIDRKVIRAPFTGAIGIRQVNLGQYLAGGAPIVSLQAIRPVYVNFTVPQQELSRLNVGATIHVTSDAIAAPEEGRITAVDSTIDETTRNVHVQATLENRSGKLRPGMYVQTSMARGAKNMVITLPVSAINYAPFGDSVFIVEQVTGPDKTTYLGVRQQFVKVGGTRGDQIAILSGLQPGQDVVTSGVFKLRPGSAVIVNNAIQPSNEKAPRPEDS